MSAKEKENHNLCMTTHEEYERIAAIIDSGASETVASVEKTTASGITYSSGAEKQADDIVYFGQRKTFETSTNTAPRVGPSSRCAEDLFSSRYWKPSADWMRLSFDTASTATARSCGSRVGLTTLIYD